MKNEFSFNTKIVGTSFEGRQEYLKQLKTGDVLVLECEPTNSFDKNAIKVLTEKGVHLGYIPKDTAAKLNQDVLANSVVCEVAELTGGTAEKSNIGCNIKLSVTRTESDGVQQ